MKQVNEEDRKIGQRVRAARLTRGMSQEQLAAPLGLTFQQVQKYENGTNRVSGSRLVRIASILQVSVAYLVGEDADAPKDEHLAGLSVPGGADLMMAYSAMAQKARRALVEMAEILAEARQ